MKEKFSVHSCQKERKNRVKHAENIEETNIIPFTRIVKTVIFYMKLISYKILKALIPCHLFGQNFISEKVANFFFKRYTFQLGFLN